MNYFCKPDEFGPTLKEWIKKNTDFQLNELSEKVMENHPSNTSIRMAKNNLKLSEIIKLAEYMKMPLSINFGPIEAKNKWEVKAEKNQELRRKTKLQRELIDQQRKIIQLHEELNKYEEEE